MRPDQGPIITTKSLFNSIVELETDAIQIAKALHYGFCRFNHTVNRANLPDRSQAERFDSIVQGEIATNAVVDHIRRSAKLHCCSYDELRVDDFKNRDKGWDAVVFLDKASYEGRIANNTRPRPFGVSVKSSTVPDADKDDLQKVIGKRDFKILKYSDSVKADLAADCIVQAYYPRRTANRKELDLNAVQSIIDRPSLSLSQLGELADLLRLDERSRGLKIVGFALEADIVRHVESSEKKFDTMPVGGQVKSIWNTKIADVGRPMDEFKDAVRETLAQFLQRQP